MKKLVNHVIFLMDKSGSMSRHLPAVNKVFKNTVTGLQGDQDTLVSVYSFSDKLDLHVFNAPTSHAKDIHISGSGYTALLDSMYDVIEQHQKIPLGDAQDHTFLFYIITDGEEYGSRRRGAGEVKQLLNRLPDNWTVAAFVPDAAALSKMKSYGVPAGNVTVWDTTSTRGVEEVSNTIAQTYASYNSLRSTGATSTKTLFADLGDLTKRELKKVVPNIDGRVYVTKGGIIADVVPHHTKRNYHAGEAYYELDKTERVQKSKAIVIMDTRDPTKFYGGMEARQLLGLPDSDVRLKPGDFGNYRVFIQSKSYSRILAAGQAIFVQY